VGGVDMSVATFQGEQDGCFLLVRVLKGSQADRGEYLSRVELDCLASVPAKSAIRRGGHAGYNRLA
jgi:hypothetical protein